ncbi:Glutathione-disulfide reductase [Gloeocapsa sp. PCC 7428]|uniref:glutathione-disulfide reductase n=1 Tax=Gloeocapsa sp. PCC 7428 TaxID=1173026 RepID=UPI0002A61030|nr:glutathione-disulfide reductase [Gloeocapsa sp. PCC 7428]AFZ30090.1 Glutathione-disulfide reductase [Gloeocapsa sp. PCC 7428]
MTFDYNFLVIGAGPGGIAAAKQAASYGVRVAVAEQEAIGGTCVNRGCIPKKFIVYAADIALQDQLAPSYGWSECQRRFDWSQFISKVHQQVEKRNQSYLQTFQKAGIELLRGHATLLDPHTIEINDRKITADKILVAVGGQPNKPDIPGSEFALTSREMFQLQQLPQKLAIVGGGYIGVEFASMMNAFGVEVTLMDTDELILDGFDNDLRSSVQEGLIQRGIQFLGKTTVKEIQKSDQRLHLTLSGDTEEAIAVDTILVATGRTPNTKNLGLENAGVELGKKGAIQVDEYNRTTQDHIFAVGDCISRVPLTPVARTEGEAVAKTAFGNKLQKVNYEYVSSAVFARPEAATVGMTEDEAREQYGDAVQCYRTAFEPLFYSMIERKEQAMMKLVVDSHTERVLGAHMVGEHAADIIQSLAVAIRKGITKEDLDATIGIHPTTGEEFLTLD